MGIIHTFFASPWWQRHRYEVLILALLLLCFYLLYRYIKRRPLGYKPTEMLFTPTERKFFFALHEAVSDRYYVTAKVRMADVLLPRSTNDKSRWQRAFNKVACKHFDYVLCDAKLRIVAAIELDDATHGQKARRKRDRFVDWACKSAGVPLVRFVPEKEYDKRTIRRRIDAACRRS